MGHTVCPSVKHIFIMSAAAPKAKKAAKKAPAAHPPYASMITTAIKKLADKKGSSRQAILKYVVANNKVDAAKAAVRVRLALKKMLAAKKLVPAAAGRKGAGSLKLPAKEPKAKKAKKPKQRRPRNPRQRRLRSLLLRRLPSQRPPRSQKLRSPLQRRPRSKRLDLIMALLKPLSYLNKYIVIMYTMYTIIKY